MFAVWFVSNTVSVEELHGDDAGSRSSELASLRSQIASSDLPSQCVFIIHLSVEEVASLRNELFAMAQSERWPANELAVQRLRDIGENIDGDIKVIQRRILSDRRSNRVSGLRSMERLDSETAKLFRSELYNYESQARSAVLRVLSEHDRLSPSEVYAYLDDPDPSVRYEAAKFLVKTELRSSVLVKCVNDSEEIVVISILDELRPEDGSLEMVQRIAILLTDPCLGCHAARALGLFGDASVAVLPELIAAARYHPLEEARSSPENDRLNDGYYASAIAAMERIGPPLHEQISYVSSLLRDNNILVRSLAASAIGQCGTDSNFHGKNGLCGAIEAVIAEQRRSKNDSASRGFPSSEERWEVLHYLKNLWLTGCEPDDWLAIAEKGYACLDTNELVSLLRSMEGKRHAILIEHMLAHSLTKFQYAALQSLRYNPVYSAKVKQLLIPFLEGNDSDLRWDALEIATSWPTPWILFDDKFLQSLTNGHEFMPKARLFLNAIRGNVRSPRMREFLRSQLTSNVVTSVCEDGVIRRSDAIRYLAFEHSDPVETVEWLIKDLGFHGFEIAWALRDRPAYRAAAIDYWVGMPDWEVATSVCVPAFSLLDPDSTLYGCLWEMLVDYRQTASDPMHEFKVDTALYLMTRDEQYFNSMLRVGSQMENQNTALLYLERQRLELFLDEEPRSRICQWITTLLESENHKAKPKELIAYLGRLNTQSSKTALQRLSRSADWQVRQAADSALRSLDAYGSHSVTCDMSLLMALPHRWENCLCCSDDPKPKENDPVEDVVKRLCRDLDSPCSSQQIQLAAGELRGIGKSNAIAVLRSLRDSIDESFLAAMLPLTFEPIAADGWIRLLPDSSFPEDRPVIHIADSTHVEINGAPYCFGSHNDWRKLFDTIGTDFEALLNYVERDCILRCESRIPLDEPHVNEEVLSLLLASVVTK